MVSMLVSGSENEQEGKMHISPNPVIGEFNTNEVRSWTHPTQKTSKSISFLKPYPEPPGLPIGLKEVSFVRGANLRVRSYADRIDRNSFQAHIDTWEETKLTSAGCTWLEIAAGHDDFQFGTYNTHDDRHWTRSQQLNTRAVTFPRAFRTPPKVVIWLSGFDMDRRKNLRLKTYATHVKATGFTLHIDSWLDSIVYSATASWVAYPADKANISSGTASTLDQRPANRPQLYNTGYVNFGNNVFTAAPRTIVGISSLDIDHRQNITLAVKASNVNAMGMTWHANSWDDTVLYSAGISYIAMV